jgi:hypothetical protein
MAEGKKYEEIIGHKAKDAEKIVAVLDERDNELSKSDAEFESQINKSDKFFDNQAYKVKEWGDKQTELQKENLDFTIDTINQQKDQAKKDYTKEQSGAYVDWQKQSNQYGANAERMASAGMSNSGYSESSQVSMYNAYQSRLTAARESYNRAVLNYDNAIKEAQLQNSSILAEIAYSTLQQQLELSLQGFQYKNNLILEKANQRRQIQSLYQSKYMDVLNQINTENARKEQIRQFNEQMAFDKERFAWQQEQAEKESGSGFITPDNGTKTYKGYSKSQMSSVLQKSPIRDYRGAIAFMKIYGLSDGGQGLLTDSEWQAAKGDEAKYATYGDYVNAYLTWRINES